MLRRSAMLDKAIDDLIVRDDTIVALATPEGRAGLGVIRVSGPAAVPLIGRFFRSREPLRPRQARFGDFGPPGEAPLDQVVVTVFQGPHSYTGEDVAEVSAHGNPLILNEIASLLVRAGARPARRGEFTLRAVANGKMNLAQAEALRSFVEAETVAQARVAMRQMAGAVSTRVRPLTEAIVGVIVALEAGIDFAEDDIEQPSAMLASADLAGTAEALRTLAGTFDYGRLLTGGVLLAVVGRPNVGKSSVFNRLLAHDRAIVTEFPGTTRDVLTETIVVSGVPVRLADTAGLRSAAEPVEALGVERSRQTAADADLVLLVLDGSRPLGDEDYAQIRGLRKESRITVVNKRDLPAAWDPASAGLGGSPVHLSALTGEGFADLERAMSAWLVERRPAGDEGFAITSLRQSQALTGEAARALAGGVPHEMALVSLYQALDALGEVTGEVTNEDILGQIFSTFCIGK
jgi:tRNA modification GTPase